MSDDVSLLETSLALVGGDGGMSMSKGWESCWRSSEGDGGGVW